MSYFLVEFFAPFVWSCCFALFGFSDNGRRVCLFVTFIDGGSVLPKILIFHSESSCCLEVELEY